MRVLVQRVERASVTTDEGVVGSIGPGLLALVGVTHEDDSETISKMARKLARLRIFGDDQGKMNESVLDTGGSVLAVSQFTLYADARSGNRPSYTRAAGPEAALPAFEEFVTALQGEGVSVATGTFGAHMRVELLNDGPVTIWLDSSEVFGG